MNDPINLSNQPNPNTFECINCGAAVLLDARKCPHCGLDFYPPEEPSAANTIAPIDQPNQADQSSFECFNCGATVLIEARTCPQCGMDFYTPEDPTPKKDIRCSRCGGALREGITIDRGPSGRKYNTEWVQGRPQELFLAGLDTTGLPTYYVITYRCEVCGYLESFAEKQQSGMSH